MSSTNQAFRTRFHIDSFLLSQRNALVMMMSVPALNLFCLTNKVVLNDWHPSTCSLWDVDESACGFLTLYYLTVRLDVTYPPRLSNPRSDI